MVQQTPATCRSSSEGLCQTEKPIPDSVGQITDLKQYDGLSHVTDLGRDYGIASSASVRDDEHDGRRYTLLITLYGPEGNRIQRFASVFCTAESRDKALQIGRMLCQLRREQQTTLKQPVRFLWDTQVAQFWVTAEQSSIPNVVGETRTTHVTYFDVNTPIQPNEFNRVIAHEWGHLAIQAARGYTHPESDSSGFIGEILGLNWLLNSQVPVTETESTPKPTRQYVRSREETVLQALEKFPPGSPGFIRRDAIGMEVYAGAMVHVHRNYGWPFLGQVLKAVDTDQADAFLTAWAFVVSEQAKTTLVNHAWIPLEIGNYRLSRPLKPIHVRGPKSVEIQQGILSVQRSGWYKINCGTQPVSLQRSRK